MQELAVTKRFGKFGNSLLTDFLLLAAILVVVHGIYVAYIFPQSIEIIQASEGIGIYPARNPIIIVKDFEQEICIILGLWCLALLFRRYHLSDIDLHLLEVDFTGVQQMVNDLETIESSLTEADQIAPNSILVPATRAALDSYRLTGSYDSARHAAFEYCSLQEEVLESKLTAIRYILWAIPSIGFLGTVRGIGEALTRANEAIQGDISGVAASLGVAFNSTFVALLVSLALTMISNGLRGREQDRLVKCKTFISGTFLLQLRDTSLKSDGNKNQAH
jgi:biopolymer transport protein ExbB/TolQ